MGLTLEVLNVQRPARVFTSRDLALISAFAGLYLGYGYVSSVTLRGVTRSGDLFFLIACLFAILASVVQRPWASTLLATVTGLIFLGTPGTLSVHITVALVTNGLVFDLYLRLRRSGIDHVSRRDIVIAGTLGNLVMAAITFAALRILGLLSLPLLWVVVFVIVDGLLGVAGTLFGLGVVGRVRGISQRRRVGF